MFVAMIVLVVMALVGIAMVRQSGGGLSIAGNLALKQNATAGGDLGTETAYAWWLAERGKADLNKDAEGYFSDWGAPNSPRRSGDPTKYDWDTAKLAAEDDSGNRVDYIIERLCEQGGRAPDAPGQLCVTSQQANGKNMSGSTCSEYPAARSSATARRSSITASRADRSARRTR